jgi:cellulose synthase/poly-beta-1,6-N-acetylglucosamine synthase-like glycosyltransferase
MVRRRILDLLRTTHEAGLVEIIIALDAGAAPSGLETTVPSPELRARVVRAVGAAGKASALNAGVAAATGDVLVFTDVGQSFEPATIGRLADALVGAGSERIGAVSGSLHMALGANPAGWYWRYERWLRLWEARLHSTVGVTGAVYAMRRMLWATLPPGLILDDVYSPMQLVLRGYRVGFEPTALAWDARKLSPKDEYRRKARTLTGVLQLCAWMPAVLSPLRNPIWFQFVNHKLLRLLTPYLMLAFAVGAAGSMPLPILSQAALASLGVLSAMLILALIVLRRAREAVWTFLLMQAAVVRALYNGLRGEWDVWRN